MKKVKGQKEPWMIEVEEMKNKVYYVDYSQMKNFNRDLNEISLEFSKYHDIRGIFPKGWMHLFLPTHRFKFINRDKSAYRPLGKLVKGHPLSKKGYEIFESVNFPSDIFTEMFFTNDWLGSLKKLKVKTENALKELRMQKIPKKGDKKVVESDKRIVSVSMQQIEERITNLKFLKRSIEDTLGLLGDTKGKASVCEISNYSVRIGALAVLAGLHEYPDAISGQKRRRAGSKRSPGQFSVKTYPDEDTLKVFEEKRQRLKNHSERSIIIQLAKEQGKSVSTIRRYLGKKK